MDVAIARADRRVDCGSNSNFEGLKLAHDIGFWPCVIESNALVVVNLVKGNNIVNSKVGLIINDIIQLLHFSPGCSICFVLIKANMAAHSLAELGLSFSYDRFWMEEAPLSVAPVVLGHCPNQL
ncbi:hypothetical protein Dsin_015985 [Dipteronia sinensis]|uniref:RNase H type-1 domain-containing protein n=1 Tax=Dipteronia sinensis TaxID=43782 RepID=A0AAE0E571_9ROSI|nr:hypothetical protein Dsin_015985 [Dipteronia sinensis]